MMTHHPVTTSSLCTKKLKIDKFCGLHIRNVLIEETARHRNFLFPSGSLWEMAQLSSDLRRKC